MSKKWWDNEISLGIMKKKYLHDGEVPEDLLKRVSSIFSKELQPLAYKVLSSADFMPAGRTLFGAGYKGERKVSLSNCFLAGTKVATRRGLLNIEDVIDGDEVMTSNGYRVVNAVMSREFNGDLFKLKGSGLYDDIMCTPNHRFLTNKGWARADRLFKGSLLMATPNYDNRESIKHSPECAKWIRLSAVEVVENQHTTVYNLSVEENHQYNVNGVICHNCYIMPSPEDNIESIFDTAKRIARISSYGGGCGVSISNLRPKGAAVNNSAMTSTGAVSFLNIFDVTGSTIGQNGRRAALMVGLDCTHPDIEEFLRVKQNNEKLSSMNISIKFTDEFMNAVKNKEKFTLHFDGENEYIEKKIDAYDFFKEFCETQWNYGDPGALFIDRIRSFNLLSGYDDYNIDITNP